jgi:hypothetical protein
MPVPIGQLGTRRPERGCLPATVDDDVGTGNQVEEPAAVVFVEWIEHRAALVGVMHCERDARCGQGGQHAASGTSARRFHLEDVGTQVGEQPRHRVSPTNRQVQDAHGIEQPVGHLHTVPAWSVGHGCQQV